MLCDAFDALKEGNPFTAKDILEETLSACFYMKNYTELLDKIGEFLVNIKYDNQKIIKEKSEMVENLLG